VTHDASNRAAWREALESGVKADVCWTFDAAGFKAMLRRALG